MWIYIANIAILPFYGMFRKRNIGIFFAGIQMFLILAFRDITVGADLGNYIGGFKFISGLSFVNLCSRFHLVRTADLIYPYSYESGYCLLNWLCGKIGISFHGFLVICAAFIIFSTCRFIAKYSYKPWMSFCLFVGLGMYEYSFGILRQSLAVAILLYAFDYIKLRKWRNFIVIVFVAFTIHRLSIIFVILYFLIEKPITKKFMMKFFCFCIVFLGLSRILYVKIISNLLHFIGKETYGQSTFAMNNQILIMFLLIVLIFIFVDFKIFKEKNMNMFMWAFMCSIPVEILGMNNEGFARAIEIFYISVIILLPNIIRVYGLKRKYNQQIIGYLKKSNRQTSLINLFASLFIYMLMIGLLIYSLKNSVIVPYELYKGV